MKKILFIVSLFICGIVKSQIYTPSIPTAYGQNFLRIKAFNVLHVPNSGSDTSLNTSDTSSQLRIINGKLMYHFGYWREATGTGGGGGGGGTELDPVWLAQKNGYYTIVNLQTSGQAAVHWGNITNVPSFLITETDPTVNSIIKNIPTSADATNYKYLGWNGSAYVRKQVDYFDLSNRPNGMTWSGALQGTAYFSTNTLVDATAIQYTFVGSSPATLTLPSFSSFSNRTIWVKNIGSAALTISGTIYTTTTVSSMILASGESVCLNTAASSLTNTWIELFKSNTSTETDPNALLKANNLSDLTNTITARNNIGLGASSSPTFANQTLNGKLNINWLTGVDGFLVGDIPNRSTDALMVGNSTSATGDLFSLERQNVQKFRVDKDGSTTGFTESNSDSSNKLASTALLSRRLNLQTLQKVMNAGSYAELNAAGSWKHIFNFANNTDGRTTLVGKTIGIANDSVMLSVAPEDGEIGMFTHTGNWYGRQFANSSENSIETINGTVAQSLRTENIGTNSLATTFYDATGSPKGIKYNGNYHSTQVARSLVDKGYVDSIFGTGNSAILIYDSTQFSYDSIIGLHYIGTGGGGGGSNPLKLSDYAEHDWNNSNSTPMITIPVTSAYINSSVTEIELSGNYNCTGGDWRRTHLTYGGQDIFINFIYPGSSSLTPWNFKIQLFKVSSTQVKVIVNTGGANSYYASDHIGSTYTTLTVDNTITNNLQLFGDGGTSLADQVSLQSATLKVF